ncbi:hypothetical protein ABZ543_25000 [Streptomyces roseifaciens]
MRGKLLTLAGAAALLLTAAGGAQAHSSNDWRPALSYGTTENERWASGWVGGSTQRADGGAHIKWTGTKVGVQAWTRDHARDGYCAVTQIRYHVKDGGQWADHWHYRSPAVDCTDGNDGIVAQWYGSRKPIKDVQARVCLGNASGTPVRDQCHPWD